jgi:hypothetical protein
MLLHFFMYTPWGLLELGNLVDREFMDKVFFGKKVNYDKIKVFQYWIILIEIFSHVVP